LLSPEEGITQGSNLSKSLFDSSEKTLEKDKPKDGKTLEQSKIGSNLGRLKTNAEDNEKQSEDDKLTVDAVKIWFS
jgi:hypothetical protein